MIRAAVQYAEEKGPPPSELKKYLKWKTWGALPLAGGTDDQRAGELERMLVCANTYELWSSFKRRDLKLDKMSSGQKKMLKAITDLMNG